MRAVKSAVDKDNTPGQYVLAGSTRFLADPTLHESLAGRAGVLEVLPFSQSELAGTRGDLLDITFAGDADRIRRLPAQPQTREDYLALMVRGTSRKLVRLKSARTPPRGSTPTSKQWSMATFERWPASTNRVASRPCSAA